MGDEQAEIKKSARLEALLTIFWHLPHLISYKVIYLWILWALLWMELVHLSPTILTFLVCNKDRSRHMFYSLVSLHKMQARIHCQDSSGIWCKTGLLPRFRRCILRGGRAPSSWPPSTFLHTACFEAVLDGDLGGLDTAPEPEACHHLPIFR